MLYIEELDALDAIQKYDTIKNAKKEMTKKLLDKGRV